MVDANAIARAWETYADALAVVSRLEPGDDGALAGGALRVRSDAELEAMPAMAWLADGILPLGSLAAIYGAPGAGKSFVALDLVFSVAIGRPWLGRSVETGGALYIAGEGLSGLSQRIVAWKTAYHVLGQSVGVGIVSEGIDLLKDTDVGRAMFAATAPQVAKPIRLVVLDTLARSMVGDENDTRDMSRVIASADRIRRVTGAAVLLVHHTRKDSDQERGSTALRGAVDTLMLCQETDAGRQLSCVKQKDAEPFATIPFQLVAGHGSCVVASTGSESPPGSAEPGPYAQLTPQRLKGLRTLSEAFTDRGATSSEWLKASDMPERTYYHIRTWLVREGYVLEKGTRYVLTPTGLAATRPFPTAKTANGLQSPLQSTFGNPPKGGSHVAVSENDCNANCNGDGYWGDLMNDIDRRGSN